MGKFKIPTQLISTPKCIRFPNKTIERVERAIVGTDCTFSSFVVAAVNNALDELNESEEIDFV